MTFTLVMLIAMASSIAPVVVPGFPTEQACLKEADKQKSGVKGIYGLIDEDFIISCIPSK